MRGESSEIELGKKKIEGVTMILCNQLTSYVCLNSQPRQSGTFHLESQQASCVEPSRLQYKARSLCDLGDSQPSPALTHLIPTHPYGIAVIFRFPAELNCSNGQIERNGASLYAMGDARSMAVADWERSCAVGIDSRSVCAKKNVNSWSN